ncbi:MAG: GtrA family protein [Clostridia bacterium]|nr:GtrA family protein [Clostridia bacterium]
MIKKIKALFEKYPTLAEIFRFCIVGGIATVVDFFVMGIVLYCFDPDLYPHFFNVFIGGKGNPSLTANMFGTGAGFVVGLFVNYLLSICFVFQEKGNSQTALGFIEFALLSAVGLALHEIGMYVLNDVFAVNEWVVKIIMTFIVLIYNYISRKTLIFKKKAEKTETEAIEDAPIKEKK